jgi:hypothetical protein
MRSNLPYQQASANANNKAVKAFNEAKANGAQFRDCQEVARLAYEAEMKYYETTEH